ncbi:MAG: DUF4418 family protein [Clostridia bacterium]|nr:DUF4418 family protein [Clostridia bacterium]
MKKRDIAFGLIVGILGLVLAVGAQTFARPCVHADGSAAVCAPVKTWLTVEGGLIAVLSGLSMIRPSAVAQGIAAAGGLLAALTPGLLIPICKSDMMACQRVTRPTALVIGILVGIVSLWWLALTLTSKKREARS